MAACSRIEFALIDTADWNANFVLRTDCSQAESCDLCVGESMLNLTGCVWKLCPNGNTQTHTPLPSDSNPIITAAVTVALPVWTRYLNYSACQEHTHTHTEYLFFVSGNDTGTCVIDQGDSADSSMNCSWTRVSELCTGTKQRREMDPKCLWATSLTLFSNSQL